MTTSRQPKGIPVGGQFAPDTHSEPVTSLRPGLPAIGQAARISREARFQQIDVLSSAIAVDSAVAVAARTKTMFPTASRVVFDVPGEEDYLSPQPLSVLDSDGNVLTSRFHRGEDADIYEEWAEGGDDPESVEEMTLDLEDHNGKLDGILTKRTPAGGIGMTFELDINKALETS